MKKVSVTCQGREGRGRVWWWRDILLSKSAESNLEILNCSTFDKSNSPWATGEFKNDIKMSLNCCLYLSLCLGGIFTFLHYTYNIMQYSPSFPDVLNMKLRKHYKKTFFILCYSWRSKTTPVSPCATFKKTGF